MYQRCLDAIVEEHQRRGPGNVSAMIATHNEETVRYTVQLMKGGLRARKSRAIVVSGVDDDDDNL